MKLTKKQLESRLGFSPDDVRKVGTCPKSEECFGYGEVNECENGNYENCELYLKMLKGGGRYE